MSMSSQTSFWSLEVRDRVGVLTFSRPPANWMNLEAMAELSSILEHLPSRTEEIAVLVLTGGVDGYFVANADLDELAGWSRSEPPSGDQRSWHRALRRLEALPQPTVAAIDGQAWGGGCEIALACSMRLASTRAHLALPEVGIGIIPGCGGTQRSSRVVGVARAVELCTTGRRVFATEALEIGLVNKVVPDPFMEGVLQWCGKITRNPISSVIAAKRAVMEGAALSLNEGLRLENAIFTELNRSETAKSRNARVVRPTAPPESQANEQNS